MADVLVINKVNSASPSEVVAVESELRAVNPNAVIVRAALSITLDNPAEVAGRCVLVIDDGPTITHGGLPYGAGFLAATAAGAQVVDPRAFAEPELLKVYAAYPHIGQILPAVGYGPAQLQALERTINAADVDVVVSGTPVDLARLLHIDKKVVRARYEFAEMDEPRLSTIVDAFLDRLHQSGSRG